MLYEEIEKKLLNGDYSEKNIHDIITKLENNDIDNDKIKDYFLRTDSFHLSCAFFGCGVGVAPVSFLFFIVGDTLSVCFALLFFIATFIQYLPFSFINYTKIKKKCLKLLYDELDKIKEQKKEKIAKLDKALLNIEDKNIKMIYECTKVIYKIMYDGREKDLAELESLYKEYMNIQVKRKLSNEPMLNSRELEIGVRIGEISSKLELIQLEISLKNSPFVKKVYMKITELKELNYNEVTEHMVLLDNLVKEYILYKRTVLINEKADFDEEELKKEAEFEKKYDDICYLIKVYQNKDRNDKILGSMFDIARGIQLDDSVVNLDVRLDNGTSLELRK